MRLECNNCDDPKMVNAWTDVEDLDMRIGPGERVPAGECQCGALLHDLDAIEQHDRLMSMQQPEKRIWHPDTEEACQHIDAAFFSGDTMMTPDAILRIQYFLNRWQKQLNININNHQA